MARPRTKNPTETVRIFQKLARLARIVAAAEDREISDVLSEVLDAPLKKRYEEAIVRLHHEKKKKE